MSKTTPKAGREAPASSDSGRSPIPTSDLLQLLVDNVKDYAILLLDTEGKVLTWSKGAERLKGWKAIEIIGQHFSRFYPAEDDCANARAPGYRSVECHDSGFAGGQIATGP